LWVTIHAKIVRGILLLLVLAVSFFSKTCPASVYLNADFSSGLLSWSSTGSVSSIGGGAVLSDGGALRSILYQGAFIDSGSYLLSFDYRSPLSTSIPVGSAADAAFATIYFSSTPASFDPTLAVGFDSFLALADFDFSGVNAYSGSTGSSSLGPLYSFYQTAFVVPAPTTAFIVFELNNLNTVNNDSSFFVDNVTVVAPEPTMVSLMISGLCVIALRRRISCRA